MRGLESRWPALILTVTVGLLAGCTSVRRIEPGRVTPNQSVELLAGTRPFDLHVRTADGSIACPTFRLRGMLLARSGDTLRIAVAERETSDRNEATPCATAEVGSVLYGQSPGLVVRASQVDVVKSAGALSGVALLSVIFFVVIAVSSFSS